MDLTVTPQETKYLRELAKKQLAYAHLPIMARRAERWFTRNLAKDARPLLVMEMRTFEDSILPGPVCGSEAARYIEHQLMQHIVNHELIDDDKVIPPYFVVNWNTSFCLFGLPVERHAADDGSGRKLGHAWTHPISDLTTDMVKLQPSTQSVDREETFARKAFVEEVIGDILPVTIENRSLEWFFTPTACLISLMGMEAMMMAMMMAPEEYHRLLTRVCDELRAHLRWQEEENLLTLNNGNHYAGAGSYGFTRELPGPGYPKTSRVTGRDLWVNMNSQESVGISPEMYGEFIFPHYRRLAQEFGLVYYGCCEPVHPVWDEYVSKLPHLRKVSISPWCDEQVMGERLRGGPVIYSRKPSPNLIGVGEFNESAFRDHIAATLRAARGCTLEIIFRDIYTLVGDRGRAGRAIAIARGLIDEIWQ